MTIIPAQLKTALAACLLFWGGIGIQAQTVPSTLRLAGLMNIFGKDQALLEVSPKRPSETLVLAELQMQKGVKVTHINQQNGTAQIEEYSNGIPYSTELTINSTEVSSNRPTLVFDKLRLQSVLDVYSQLTDRSILQSPELPDLMLSLTTFATNNGVVAGVLQKALAERGVAIISDGDKFVMVVPADRAPTVKPYSQDLKPDKDTAEIPAHAVNFAGVDIDQVADVYCRLNNRKLDASVPFPHLERHDITFTNVQMLSKAEIIYALDTLIEWSGFTLEPVGEDKMQPVAIPGEKKLNTDSQVKSY